MLQVNGHTRQMGILGYPIEHTYSPQMHNFISEKMGLNYVYTAIEVHPDNLKQAIDGLRAMQFAGANITSPHKFEVMNYLDEISPQAKMFGSVNTVVNNNGKLIGYNTDADGFYKSLLVEGIEIKGKDVLIIGAGGATKPICVLFAQVGAKSITVINRTQSRADSIAQYVNDLCNYSIDTEKKLDKYDVVINTTSVGMEPLAELSPIDDFSFIDDKTAVADMIYNPAKTIFLQQAEKRGAKIVNGLGMLIYQGVIAYELFTNTKLPDGIALDIAKEVFGV